MDLLGGALTPIVICAILFPKIISNIAAKLVFHYQETLQELQENSADEK